MGQGLGWAEVAKPALGNKVKEELLFIKELSLFREGWEDEGVKSWKLTGMR